MNIYAMSDKAIVREIGRRLKRRRLEKNLTQEAVARSAGLNRTTIGQIERGASFSILALVQILRALDALDAVDAFLPDPGISPLQLAKMKGRQRRRASPQRDRSDEGEAEW